MAYELEILGSEEEYRELYSDLYCKFDILTFDNVSVRFYEESFEHAFFESQDIRKGDKSLFAIRRAWRIKWIKETLQDESCMVKKRMG